MGLYCASPRKKKKGLEVTHRFFFSTISKTMCIDTVIVCKTGLRQINSSSFSLLHISDQMMFLFFFYRKRNVRRNRVCDGMKTGRDIALGHFTRGEGVFWKSPPPRVSQSDWTFSIGKNIKIKTGFSTNTVLHYNISCRLIKTRFSIHIPVVSKTCEKGDDGCETIADQNKIHPWRWVHTLRRNKKCNKGLGKKQDSPLFFTRENLYFYVM